MKLSIVTKINLLTMTVIIIFGLVIGWYFIKHESQALSIELDERISVLLNSLSISSEYPVLIGDREAVARIVDNIMNQKDVIYCRLEDKEGNLLYQAGSLKNELVKVFNASIKTLKRAKGKGDDELIFGEEKKVEEEIGKIFLTVSLLELNHKINDVTRAVVIFVIITIILTSMASSILLKFVLSDPINFLVKGTERIAKGDLNYKVSVKSDDEIGRLGASFNKMTEDLKGVTVSRDYVDNIINSMIDTLIVINPDTTIRTVNNALLELLGYKEDELIGKSVITIVSNEDAKLFSGLQWEELLKKGSVDNYEMNYKAKSGTYIPVSFTGSVMSDENANIISIVGIARDMREVMKLKKQLLQSEKMAAVGQLAGGVAHEINNPMSVILGFAQTVARRVNNEKDPFYIPLKSIEREAVRCKKLVGDLLTFSRVSKTGREPVDIKLLIDETLTLIESKCRVKNINLKRDVADKLPVITANKNQIQQVIVNLCNNAIDAMQNGGDLTIKAVVEGKDASEGVRIEVTDTGHGIPLDIRERIFEPFFTTKEVGQGTGLGLGISYEIVQKHGGKIEVESEVDKGSVFRIILPVNS
ncbi:MAG: PAS domain S-box protein [Endomicrobiales bacterium]|nr:PAS domain S-box protein [Endomicrobiales bacterium]